MGQCWICNREGDALTDRRTSPILPGWPKGWGEPEPIQRPAHADCYRAWYRDVYDGLAELDRSMNECASFDRTPGTGHDGFLCWGGRRLACKSWWRGDETEAAYPHLRGRPWWTPRRVRSVA